MGRGFDPHPVHKRDESLGEMSEWSNEPVLKTGVLVRVPGVRIPLSPLKLAGRKLFLYMDVYIMFILLIDLYDFNYDERMPVGINFPNFMIIRKSK